MKTLYAFLIFLAALSGTSNPTIATTGASDWQKTEQSEVRLIAATQSIGTDDALRLGLHFRLQPGWKVYWRSPGDAGFPPQLEWNGSNNLKSATLQWPAPKRFSVLGIETLGYKDELVLPIIALQITPNAATTFEAQLRYLVCNEICIPYDTSLSLHLPKGNGEPSEFTHLINRYQSNVPGNGSVHGLKIIASRTTKTANKTTLQLALNSTSPLTNPDVYFEGPDELTFTKPKITLGPDQRTALLEVDVDGLKFLEDDVGKTIKGREFTVTMVDGKRSAEQKLIIGDPLFGPTAQAPPSSSRAEVSILYILALGILGGLILNLMPCVLPVLSIKVLSVVGHGGSENKAVRLSFLASAAGIISSFLVLAAALTILKSAGMAVGWGIQFQYPWFLIGLIILVLLFASNLWGFFELRLPNALSQVGANGHNTNHLSSHFMQGAFVTLLATPCSAPFLGTAVGFALARGTAEIFAIFLALGVGLALPFLIFALFPSMITRLPHPGPWMIRLRIFLGFTLAATAAWLISILTSTLGSFGAAIVALGGVCMIAVLYYNHTRLQTISKGAWGCIAALIIATFVLPDALGSGPDKSININNARSDVHWHRFDLAAIPGLVTAGNTVLVDVTADWCITCKVNKALVFGKGAVTELMDKSKVIAMQADWTRPDPTITKYLSSFGRYGIPFNIVYGPKSPDGIVLPEILTKSTVILAISEASTSSNIAKQTN